MRDSRTFEQRLAASLEAYAGARRPVDASAIAHRAAAPSVVSWRGSTQRAWSRRRASFWLVAAAIASIALIGSVLLAGSRNPPTPTQILPPPSGAPSVSPTVMPSALPSTPPVSPLMSATFSCAQAQAGVGVHTTEWVSGPPPAPVISAQNGWIAVWGAEQTPEVILVDPITGAQCPTARFTHVYNDNSGGLPARGPLVWSPDGRALAMALRDEENLVRELYVWSPAGLLGPLVSEGEADLGTPVWSPDGSRLAISMVARPGFRTGTTIRIFSKSAPHDIDVGCACAATNLSWSPSGTRIGAPTQSNSGVLGFAAGPVDGTALTAVKLTESERATPQNALAAPYGWVDDDTLLFINMAAERFVARPIQAGKSDRILGPIGTNSRFIYEDTAFLAPDRTAWLIRDRRLFVDGITADDFTTIVSQLPDYFPVGWAPNSLAVGYVIDNPLSPDRGIWTVNRDGSDWRQVAAGAFALQTDGSAPFAWQPVWPKP